MGEASVGGGERCLTIGEKKIDTLRTRKKGEAFQWPGWVLETQTSLGGKKRRGEKVTFFEERRGRLIV